jgi:hypothetical protein
MGDTLDPIDIEYLFTNDKDYLCPFTKFTVE